MTQYGGAIPDKSVMTKDEFADSINPYLNFFNVTTVPELTALETNVNAKEISAVSASAAAVAAAHFQGTWTNELTSIPQSWEYDGVIYGVLVAGTDSPVTTPSNWFALTIAQAIKNTPSGSISATTVQAALNELDTEKINKNEVYSPNLLINSNGLVNQDAYISGTATTASNQYTIDMFRVVTSGQNLTFTTTAGATTFTAPAGGVDLPIENKDILGGSYVLSFLGTATAVVAQSSNNVTYADVTPTAGVYTITGGYYVRVRFTNGTFSKPKFEEGTIATPYSLPNIEVETAKCMRYYEKIIIPINKEVSLLNFYSTTSAFGSSINFLVTKRVTPTITFSDVATWDIRNNVSGALGCAAIGFAAINAQIMGIALTATTATTAGIIGRLRTLSDAYIIINSRL